MSRVETMKGKTMNQENELVAVKRKIRALLAKTVESGATEAETGLAMAKVGELLEQYNLSMDEVSLRQENCLKKEFVLPTLQKNAAFSTLSCIGRFCQVTVWFSRVTWGEKSLKLNFFGLEQDVDLAIFLAELIQNSEQTELKSFRLSDVYRNFVGHRKNATHNFKRGFIARIGDRLDELTAKNREKEIAAAEYHAVQMRERMLTASAEAQRASAEKTTGTQLISLAKERYVDEEFKRLGITLTTKTSYDRARVDWDSRAAGLDAANNVNLSRPISRGGGGTVLQITG